MGQSVFRLHQFPPNFRITPDFSMETIKARRSWSGITQTLREALDGCHPRLLYPAKLSINIDGENKTLHDKIRFNQYLSTNPALQKVLEGKLQPKEVSYTKKTQVIDNSTSAIQKEKHTHNTTTNSNTNKNCRN